MNRRWLLVAALVANATSVAAAEEFPDGAVAMQPAEVTRQFSGKVFSVRLKDGRSWRFDFKANGFFFFHHSSGPSDSGDWRVEDSRLCLSGRKLIQPSCNDVRLNDTQLLLKRDNGDVVEFVEQAS